LVVLTGLEKDLRLTKRINNEYMSVVSASEYLSIKRINLNLEIVFWYNIENRGCEMLIF